MISPQNNSRSTVMKSKREACNKTCSTVSHSLQGTHGSEKIFQQCLMIVCKTLEIVCKTLEIVCKTLEQDIRDCVQDIRDCVQDIRDCVQDIRNCVQDIRARH